MANVVYAVVDGPLEPTVEAVLSNQTGEMCVGPGVTLAKVANAIREEADQVPQDSPLRFLGFNPVAKRHAWVSAPESIVVEPEQTYYFKLSRGQPTTATFASPARRPEIVHFEVLHESLKAIKGLLQLNVDTIDGYGFQRFSSEQFRLCNEVVASLPDCEAGRMHTEDFERRYGIALSFQNSEDANMQAGIILKRSSFSCLISLRGLACIESRLLPCDVNNYDSLTEIAFLLWIRGLLRIKHRDTGLYPGLSITLSGVQSHLQVEIVQELHRNMPSAVFSARDVTTPDRQLVLKIGHSPEMHQLVEDLYVGSRLWYQAENEASFLSELKGCDHVPPLVISCAWNSMPVVAMQKAGVALVNEDFSTSINVANEVGDALLRDLARTVLHLDQEHGVAHGDIKPTNIGVYFRPEDHGNRRFYLYDFGLALRLRQGNQRPGAGSRSLHFSSCDTLKEGSVDLLSELVAVVYTCLHLAGLVLPWHKAADAGDVWACIDARRDFAEDVTRDASKLLSMLSPAIRSWIVLVLSPEHPSAAPPSQDEIREATRHLLSLEFKHCN